MNELCPVISSSHPDSCMGEVVVSLDLHTSRVCTRVHSNDRNTTDWVCFTCEILGCTNSLNNSETKGPVKRLRDGRFARASISCTQHFLHPSHFFIIVI